MIPTGSMEDTLLIGDHLLVDKLAFAPSGPVSKYLLPYTDVKRGDIIVFRYPVDITQTFVKRCIGVPGDHIRIINKQVYLQRRQAGRAVQVSQDPITSIPTATISPASRTFPWIPAPSDMLQNHVVNGEVVVPPELLFRDGRQSRFLARQPLLGLRAAREHHRQAADHLLVVRRAYRPAATPLPSASITSSTWRRISSPRPAGAARFMLIHGYPDQIEPHEQSSPTPRGTSSMSGP